MHSEIFGTGPGSNPARPLTAATIDDLVLLAKVRRRNESMLHVGFSYGARKKLLTEFATRERTKAISASPKTREPSLCATSV